MVVTRRPWTCESGTRHELTGASSSRIVHAPHSPSPQPSFVPVRPQSSRSTSRRRFIGCASTETRFPFRTNAVLATFTANLRTGDTRRLRVKCATTENTEQNRGHGMFINVHQGDAFSELRSYP